MNWILRAFILVVVPLLAQDIGDPTAIVNPVPTQDPAGNPTTPGAPGVAPIEYVCPMHPNERATIAGKCRLCGMTLVAGIPDLHEYPVHLTTVPKILKPGVTTNLRFSIEDP